MTFLDASAGVKRYLDEIGSDVARSAVDPTYSDLTRVEFPSAIWRKERDGRLTVDQVGDVLDSFLADWMGTPSTDPTVATVALDGAVLTRAAHLTGRHGLRAGDAVQLACALSARQVDPTISEFVCFDLRLRDAAAREGFRLVPAAL